MKDFANVEQVKIVRSGRVAVTGTAAGFAAVACLLTGCGAGAPAGVAGVSTLPPVKATAGTGADSGHVAAVAPPQGGEPVKVPPPKLSEFTYAFPVTGCKVSYARKLLALPKTTIWAAKGCAFVSPVGGVVREVNAQNRWKPSTDRGPDREGRFVTVLGEDGVLYLGGHLDSIQPNVRPGLKVKAGQMLGRVGNSGNARSTGSNLYFAVTWATPPQYWWVRRGMVGPWDYLDAWDNGNRTVSPRKAVLALRKRVGALPQCTALCAGRQPSADPGGRDRPGGGGGGHNNDQPPVVTPLDN